MAYRIEYSPACLEHLRRLPAGEQAAVLDAIDRQLAHQPMVETRNRKPMRPNPLAPWELRLGHPRVYYDVEADSEQVVRVLAVGIKERERVRIGDKEMRL